MATDLVVLEVLPEHRQGRGRFWRPDGAGYTDDLIQAGVYAHDSPHVQRAEKAVPKPLSTFEGELIDIADRGAEAERALRRIELSRVDGKVAFRMRIPDLDAEELARIQELLPNPDDLENAIAQLHAAFFGPPTDSDPTEAKTP